MDRELQIRKQITELLQEKAELDQALADKSSERKAAQLKKLNEEIATLQKVG